MAYKVLVMSPLHNNGSTVVSALMAQGLTYANKTVTLAYTDSNSLMPKYLGVNLKEDPTRSIMQVVRLIDSNAIADDDILDYAVQYSKNVYLMSFTDMSLPDKDRIQIVEHVYKRVPTDIAIVDCPDDIDSVVASRLLDDTDLLFVVTTLSYKGLTHLKYWLNEPIVKEFPNVCVVVNNYNEVVGNLRGISKSIGLPHSRVCKLHYNPWITKCSMESTLSTVVPKVIGIDPRVANLSSDIKELNECIISNMTLASRALKG